MKINPKFQSLIPPLTPEELAQLEANLRADGCRDLLVTWRGQLLDGHNRLAICERLGLKFKTAEVELPDEDAACVWVIRNQFGRRNLTPYVRAELALKLEPLVKQRAKERQVESGRAGGTSPAKGCQKSDNPPIDTKKEIAKAAHVSHDTIAKVKVIEARASDETKAALRAGETSINAEYKKLTVHVGHNSGENEWYTPAAYIEAASVAMGGIDCDPASSKQANKVVKAAVFFDAASDGLSQQWSGRVWLNPPYAQPLIAQFSSALADKFNLGEISQACVLVNNATETAWFQKMLVLCSAVCFPSGRVRFLDPAGNPGAPLQGQAVLYFGKREASFQKAFSGFGPVLRRE